MPAVVKFVLVSSLACLALISIPNWVFIWAILWGVSLVMGGYYLSRTQLLLVFALNILLIYGMAGWISLSAALGFYGIPAIIMGLLLCQGKSYYDLLRGAMFALLLTLSFFLGLSYYNLGDTGINTLEKEMQAYSQESLEWSDDNGLIAFYEERGISRAELEQAFTSLTKTIFNHLPALFCLQAILLVYLILYFSSLLAQKRKLPILQRRPFSEEIMPWQLAWLVIAGLACWLLGRDEMQLIYYVGSNILFVMVPITVYFGTSHLVYRLKHWPGKSKKWIIALIVILTLFFTVSAIIFIGLMGLFDSLLDYRKLRKKKEGIS